MKQIKLKMIGTSPLLQSSDRLSDPLDPATVLHKQLTSKRKKTEEDLLAIARSQWEGLLYWSHSIGVYMPTQNIRAALIGGGKLNKLGMQIKRATIMLEDEVPINYGKKLTIEQLWEQKYIDRRSVVVSGARVIAYRPKFTNWECEFSMMYDETVLDERNIISSMENAGNLIGIGGFRPEKGGTFGRFNIEKIA